MTSREIFCCWSCGAELTPEQLFAHEQDRQAFGQLAALSVPLGARVIGYVALHAPAKNRMTIARKAKLIMELLPDLQREQITRNGRDWPAPRAAWSLAIDGMLSLRDQGKLTLPLSGHGYLYAVLQGMAEKVERADESQRELDRRARSTSARATGSLDIGAVLDELGPELAATQRAVAARQPAPAAAPGSSYLVRQMKAAIKPHQPPQEQP
ncbi:MAG: hypothetical protein KF796_20670 [Ramlibacter sp.]|nr:hypothetical protein [Ramlibacter sp.]